MSFTAPVLILVEKFPNFHQVGGSFLFQEKVGPSSTPGNESGSNSAWSCWSWLPGKWPVWKRAGYTTPANGTIRRALLGGPRGFCLILKMRHQTWVLVCLHLDIVIPCDIWNWNSHAGMMSTSHSEHIRTERKKDSMLLVKTFDC